MREIATIIPDNEFNDYIGRMKERLSGVSNSEGHIKKVHFIIEAVTATAGERNERVFTESQLKQLFSLAKETGFRKHG